MLHQLGFPAIISFAVMSLASAKNTLQFMLQKRIKKTKENSPCSLSSSSFLLLFLDHFVKFPCLGTHKIPLLKALSVLFAFSDEAEETLSLSPQRIFIEMWG
jgi:hypothetical protein